ncbi:hypothetical protein L6164_037327 [Bauhinia variegata]|uniref:Uncharacterized protein n=1 Tax=Bauhinia variegata TaxID=167791 RepID=A0ACB9KJV5_BAUVA|nr:hypothetical protein L6164_037327 [Bauhinia variegata]
MEKYKARLVIFGNHQVEGINYTETLALVAKMVTIRIVLAIMEAIDWELHQIDTHNAFLHGEIQEEMFIKIPPEFLVQRRGMVWELRKSLYGLE